MFQFKQGNLLTEKVEALVNTVNCVGIMGKGIALQFKQNYPENFKAYKKICDADQLHPGQMFIYENGPLLTPRYIINFPTKRHWRGKSKIEDIQSGLQTLVQEIQNYHIKSIAIPPLGCGNGGLEWNIVKPLIIQACEQIPDVQVIIFEPSEAPVNQTVKSKPPTMTRARALFIQLLERYGEPGYQLTKLEIQKLAYFLQEAGEPLKLRFKKEQFGPYADNLNHLLIAIDGYYIRGFGDRSQRSAIVVTPEGHQAAKEYLEQDPDALENLERVSKLIFGFENPYGMEMLATIHWAATHEDQNAAIDLNTAIQTVQQWSDRKSKLFKENHLRKAWQRLQIQEWLSPAAF